ncbi:MAG: VanZ family protein [Candidatus Omnitrophica bacterium]|nr:VanZ family protein [Candidatus Omnitrophota bacterium]
MHTVEYGILGFLLARAFLKSSPPFFRRSFQAWAVGIAIFYGFTDEIHQLFVPMRQPSSFDLLCDGLGAVVAQLFFIGKRGF